MVEGLELREVAVAFLSLPILFRLALSIVADILRRALEGDGPAFVGLGEERFLKNLGEEEKKLIIYVCCSLLCIIYVCCVYLWSINSIISMGRSG